MTEIDLTDLKGSWLRHSGWSPGVYDENVARFAAVAARAAMDEAWRALYAQNLSDDPVRQRQMIEKRRDELFLEPEEK